MTFAALSFLIALQTPTFAEAWRFEQAARQAAGPKIYDASTTPDKLREGLRDLEAVLAYTQRPEIEALEDDKLQIFILQKNDIYADMAVGYARLKDAAETLRCIRAIRANFGKGTPETVAAAARNGAFYGRRLGTNEWIKALFPAPEIEAEIRAIRLQDPYLRFSSYPYDTSDTPKLSEADRIAGLSTLWSEAKYNFANFDLVKSLDWNEAYAAFLPRVRQAKDRYAYYNVLREFLALLQDGHTDVALPFKLRLQKEVNAGIRTALVEGSVVVLNAAPSVLALGVSPGDVVEAIDGIPAVDYGRERWAKLASASTPQDKDVRVYTYMLWRGPEGSTVRVRLRKADRTVKTLAWRRSIKLVLPTVPNYEFKILPDGTAYFAFNTCETDDPVVGFEKNLEAIRAAGRLVIDVRVNGGGSSDVGYAILSHLIDSEVKDTIWETPQYRATYRAWGMAQEPFVGALETIKPAKDRFAGPVVVITGPRTFSAAEDFAAACKTSGRVTLLGEPTGGSTGQPLVVSLPGGGSARMCGKRDRYPDGTEFVGKGILPDVQIRPTLASIQQGKDVQLERALQVLAESPKTP